MIPLDTITSLHALLVALLQVINMDLLNGMFEVAGGTLALNHCRVLYTHKETRGISLFGAVFFMGWGFWNLYYCTVLSQPISFFGGLFLVAANAFYLGMSAYYHQASITQPWTRDDEEEVYLAPESVGYYLGDKL